MVKKVTKMGKTRFLRSNRNQRTGETVLTAGICLNQEKPEPGMGLFNPNRLENSRLKRVKPDPEKNGDFQPPGFPGSGSPVQLLSLQYNH